MELREHSLLSMRHARNIRCMTSLYSFSSVHTQTKSRPFQKSPLSRAFLKTCVFGRPNRRKKCPFSDRNGYVRKRPKFFRYNRAHECLNKLAHQRGARKVRIKPSKPERELGSGTLLLPSRTSRMSRVSTK